MMIALYEKKAKIRQSMLNYLKDELGMKDKVRMCIQDAHFSYGVIKIQHTSEMVENPDGGEAMLAEDKKTPLLNEETGEALLEPEQIRTDSD
jgi:hypothetical protein